VSPMAAALDRLDLIGIDPICIDPIGIDPICTDPIGNQAAPTSFPRG